MPANMTELSSEFNATAGCFLRGDVGTDLLLTKYSVLMRHRAETPDERKVLADALYSYSLKWLNTAAKDGKVDYLMPGTMEALFCRLTEDDSISLLPATAPSDLAEASLNLMRRAEKPKALDNSDKGYAVVLATKALAYADKIQAHRAAAPQAPVAETAPKKKDESLSL